MIILKECCNDHVLGYLLSKTTLELTGCFGSSLYDLVCWYPLSIARNFLSPKKFTLKIATYAEINQWSKRSARMFSRCCEQKIVIMSVSMCSASFHTCVKNKKWSLIRKWNFSLTLQEQLETQKLFLTSEKLVTTQKAIFKIITDTIDVLTTSIFTLKIRNTFWGGAETCGEISKQDPISTFV